MDITNKSRKPLSIPLPGGKKLFLPPGKTGQIAPKDQDHPPIVALVESGDLELGLGGKKNKGGGANASSGSSGRTNTTGGIRKFGDG